MMGLPLDDRAFLLPRAEIAVRSNDVELKTKTQMELAGYLMGHIEDRKANRRDALLGMIVNGEVAERPLTPPVIMAMRSEERRVGNGWFRQYRLSRSA